MAGAVYYFAVYLPAQGAVTSGVMQQELIAKTEEFIDHTETLQRLSIDTAVLDDPNFTSLVSYSSDVPEQPIGKPNLFDPVSAAEGM